MDIKVHVKSSRSQIIVSNLICGIRGLAAMTLFFFETFPFSLLFTLFFFHPVIDEGKFIALLSWAIQLNLLWLFIEIFKSWDEFFKPKSKAIRRCP